MSPSLSPVSRAHLGYRVTVGDVEEVEARGLGIIRIHGEWPGDEIAVADGYPDD